MSPDQIKCWIETHLPGAFVTVTGDGHHFEAVVISEQFQKKRSLERSRLVYQALGDRISSGEVHALSLKTYTPSEWQSL